MKWKEIIWGVVLGILVGVGGMWLYLQYEQQQEKTLLSVKAYRARRQAHKDSLMSVRARQEALRAEMDRQESQQKVVASYLTAFYNDVVLADGEQEYHPFLAKGCHVERATFLPSVQSLDKHDREILRHYLQVVFDHDDWYRVRLVIDGTTEYRYLRMVNHGDIFLIEEVK